jgi:RNA polymerase sigma-70 factor (ECF subfamily)
VAAYLLGIARHRALKRTSVRPGDLTLDDAGVPDIAIQPTVLDDMTRDQAASALREAIAELPPAFREAIVLCDIEEMDYSDAAVVMECPIGTVRSRVHRGRALLTSRLSGVRACRAAR